ncbi:MAG TPA: hypothetical protein VG328_13190 [Stellaceae bacterium]|jgi:hypothetical protein|nr:hypothetical protein [Stellaceae bacterium]
MTAPKRKGHGDDERSDRDFYKEPGGGLIDPRGEPKHEADETTEPTEELPPEGLGKKSPDQDLDKTPQHRGG